MNIPDHDPFLDLLYIKAWLFKKKRLFLFPGEARLPVCTIRGLPSSPRRQLCFFRRRRDDAHGAESWAEISGVRLGPMETTGAARWGSQCSGTLSRSEPSI